MSTPPNVRGLIAGLAWLAVAVPAAHGGVLPPCPPDVDDSGDVGLPDVIEVLGQWGACGDRCRADVDDSGDVDIGDLIGVLSGWGACPLAPPERPAHLNRQGYDALAEAIVETILTAEPPANDRPALGRPNASLVGRPPLGAERRR